MKRCCFSLIELLITVSVLAILISLLLPVLQKTRQKVRQTQCAGNFKQCAVGWLSYCGDSDDFSPMQEDSVYDGAWRGRLAEILVRKTSYTDAKVMFCTEYAAACEKRGYTDWEKPANSWYKTVFYTGNLNFYAVKVSAVRQPSKAGIIMDGSFYAGKHSTRNLPYNQIGWRHSRNATIFVYLDGHVQAFPDTGTDQTVKNEFKLQ